MEVLELALIVLACVIGSAVLCQVVPRLSLPLVQIAVGAVVALAVPAVRDVSISSELFLVLFIAPLLFNEARETNPRDLWENKGLHSVAGRGACAAHGACGGLRVELVRALYPVGCRLRLRRRPGPHRCRRCGRTRVVGQPEEASVDAALRRVAHQRRVRRCRLSIRQCRRPHRGFLGPRCR